MGQRVIYVMTHDSIGLGEDGPTHQPVEHLASLRAIPNLLVFRPADAVETAECWELALQQKRTGPSVLALTRQDLPTLRTEHTAENLCARGGYVLAEAEGKRRRSTLIATGSEVIDRPGGAGQAGGRGHRRGGRLDALLGTVRRPGRRLPRERAGRRRRVRVAIEAASTVRLGALCRRRRRGRSA